MLEPVNRQSHRLAGRDARRAASAISRIQVGSEVRVSRIDADVDAAVEKANGVTEATASASADVIRLAQLHRQLELMAPEASGRLGLIADGHAFSMVDILSDLRRELRRR